ncbi:MAG: tetratricopeptide repeat protein [gamma proteobacterium symbiont of Bathyaustriella thionipta]|nr:tetratricopeptide repeat protein [gamma proteobacterium symbiont of Bathyaustriella thionipta]MCU7949615.1 tetratricopeptide repeat protein [gamma proteobacterium symbiont of Bathyaustriella thionipta]MCU7954757.1 tetratricopeptide repeat protein [gamma proteobacterium symbiont of Bathyaustriella thionipta]MCU7956597.1 tetratricopeptide repeat protein [gamma proteobacterium symbiont of Bathyaustriella thionipta]MCU7967909.1 tetratricopeptide repeat protein [gamma proteobacterium symbiont of 
MTKLYLVILFIISLINGCTSIDYSRPDTDLNDKYPPVNDRSSENTTQQQPRVITTALAEQAQPVKFKKKSPPPSRQAVLDLLAQSKNSMDQYHYDEAESLLKRALRIEPGNAWLWHNMAVLKFYQEDYQQAIQQALKSNNLEKNNTQLKLNNTKIIKQSYIELGDLEKARQY